VRVSLTFNKYCFVVVQNRFLAFPRNGGLEPACKEFQAAGGLDTVNALSASLLIVLTVLITLDTQRKS